MNQCLDIAVADLLSPLIRWITTNVGVERTKKIEKKRKVTHGLTRAPDVAAHLAAPLPFPALLSPLSQWKPTHTRHHHLQHHHSLTGTS